MAQLDAPTLASRWVAALVLVLGPLATIIVNGPGILGSFVFWFGLFGWLAAAIALGYVAYVLVALLQRRTLAESA